jgi:muramoyltetrapeptide carboxypeptidase
MIRPAPLRPGDRVRAVAPSSPFEPALGWRGLGWLAERYELAWDRALFARRGYLAGDDERRTLELRDALEDPRARAIVAVRGGYGLSRIAHRLDWSALTRHPKWIVGFSDITALHVEAAAAGVMSAHAPMAARLGRGHAPTRAAWLDTLEHPERPRRWDGLEGWLAGRAEGPLFGGNLTVLHACAAAGRLRVPERAVLLLEDVGERPYRLDRALSTLLAGGHLDRISGVVLGDFAECDPGQDGVCWQDALREVLEGRGVPVAAGLPCGHGERNEPIVLGTRAVLEAGESGASLVVGE